MTYLAWTCYGAIVLPPCFHLDSKTLWRAQNMTPGIRRSLFCDNLPHFNFLSSTLAANDLESACKPASWHSQLKRLTSWHLKSNYHGRKSLAFCTECFINISREDGVSWNVLILQGCFPMDWKSMPTNCNAFSCMLEKIMLISIWRWESSLSNFIRICPSIDLTLPSKKQCFAE